MMKPLLSFFIFMIPTVVDVAHGKLSQFMRAIKSGSRESLSGLDMFGQISLEDFGEAVTAQWRRSFMSLAVPIYEDNEVLVMTTILPQSFSFPLHSRPGRVLSKVLHGSLLSRELDVTQFVGDDKSAPNAGYSAFAYEDAFAGEDDCVCRGGKCPRREGCIFWVNKMLRDSASSLLVEERGLRQLEVGDITVYESEVGPRELLNSPLPQSANNRPISGVAGNKQESAIYLEVLMKDPEVFDRRDDIVPRLQYYLADRVDGAGVKGNRLRVTATDSPLGVLPMHIPWRGQPIYP
jgi:hypothetical protein